jgi:hypothetical protein
MILLGISLYVLFTKISLKTFVKGELRYRKINFFTTSALCKCIGGVNVEGPAIEEEGRVCPLPSQL